MAYIKTLKDNELVGGTDTKDVYPVSTTQALYSQEADGTVRMSKDNPLQPEKLEERLEDHEEDAQELHQKTELFSAALTASPTSTSFELVSNRRVITLTPRTTIKTYGDYGERTTTSDSSSLSVTNTDTEQTEYEPATLVNNQDGTYSWTLANKTGTQTATFTATKNGYTRTATRSAALYLRKYFAFMSSAPSTVEQIMDLLTDRATSDYSTEVKCSVAVPPNGTGAKHVYIAMPSNMSLSGYTVYEKATNLEFSVTQKSTIPRTINGKTLNYILYESVATPDSSNIKEIYIKKDE